ncbi:MAG TPA: dihydroneopterin aldolase [Candidatus Dormibacteraeota bacterium]|nr:dihydroneopterin aldolase [Candidatus Dormibacteraeota bacterium]
MDEITLRGLRAYGRHGAAPGERERAQAFEIELRCELDLQRARASDRLEDTLDYAALRERVLAIVAHESYLLLERLAERIIECCLEDQRVRRVWVKIEKPELLDGATPGVACSQVR